VEDLSRFKQTYFEESAELLAQAETGLLQLNPGENDPEEVNSIFRSVHSIKGGGGAFGFTELVAFAHEFETVMDGVRTNVIPITTELVNVLIKANDVLGQMLAYARDNEPPPPGTTDAVAAALRQFLEAGPAEEAPAPPAPPQPAPPFRAPGAADNALPATTRTFADIEDDEAGLFGDAMAAIDDARIDAEAHPAPNDGRVRRTIVFRPKPEMLLSGNEPTFMLRALAKLGETEVICHQEQIPTLQDVEGELLFMWWTVRLASDPGVGVDRINDVFEFVSDECDVLIAADALPPVAVSAPSAGPHHEAAAGAADTEHDDDIMVEMAARPAPAVATPPKTAAAPPVASAGPPATKPPADGPQRPPPGRSGDNHASALGNHTIRVDLDKIDRLVNMVGEMVITQAMIAEHVRDLPPGEFQELLEGLEQLAQHTRELRESVMSIRAQPVSSVFSRMPRLVRELATETSKEVQLVTAGENTEVDKTVVENLVDPLTHMIRNSIDHGLEIPDERVAAGKPRMGTVHLSAAHRSGRIVIEVADDGRGIDRPRVLRKAQEKGLVPQGASLSDEEIDNLIFLPGFSTADKISNISGRGVGMDVVRRNITSLGGRIGVYSTPGEGSRFVLSLPLTLAVLDGMVISVGEERFVLPLTNIVESLRPKAADLHGLVNQCDVMMARGEYVRLVYLHRLFGIPRAVGDATRGLVVLVETEDGSRLGLVVDEVLGQQQVVIKSLEANFRSLDGVAAATILGDGRVALILDVAGLREMSRHAESGGTRAFAALPSPQLEPV
jgi:two-component system chemotaxis sensor kinase CheA